MADIQRESRSLIAQAHAAQQQWLAARSRMDWVRDGLHQSGRLTWLGAPEKALNARLQQEQEAHVRSKLALDREQARGRRLEDEVLAIQDQERDRLARDLHDGICQSLAGATLLLELHLRKLRESESNPAPLKTGEKLRDILSAAIQEMRGLSHGLSGLEVGPQGEKLGPALYALAEQVSAPGNVRCTAFCPELPALGQVNATHLYRIVQEAIGNALRHGRAQEIEIRCARMDVWWELTVTDDGVGVPAGGASGGGGGLGMRSMQYRAAVLGGTLDVKRARATGERPGTMVRCVFA